MTAPVIIYVNGGSGVVSQDSPSGVNNSCGPLSGTFPHAAHSEALTRGARMDPHRVHREFPERWQRYISTYYRNDYGAICQAFGVCERTARKWCEGETGTRGGHLAMALQRHGSEAYDMLIGDAA